MSAEQVVKVLAEHFFDCNMPQDIDDVNGPWVVDCNCDVQCPGSSFLDAERAFATHQAAVLAPLITAAQAEAWAKGATSAGMNLSILWNAGIDPNPYRKELALLEASADPEGRALVQAIHDRKAQG